MKQTPRTIQIGVQDLPRLQGLLSWRRTGTAPTAAELGGRPEVDARIAQDLSSGYLWVFAAEVSGALVGYIAVAQIPKPDSRKATLYVDELWVAEPYRRQGLATKLLERVDELAAQLQVWRVRLVADAPAALALYAKHGFRSKPAMFCEKGAKEV